MLDRGLELSGGQARIWKIPVTGVSGLGFLIQCTILRYKSEGTCPNHITIAFLPSTTEEVYQNLHFLTALAIRELLALM